MMRTKKIRATRNNVFITFAANNIKMILCDSHSFAESLRKVISMYCDIIGPKGMAFCIAILVLVLFCLLGLALAYFRPNKHVKTPDN